MLRLHQIWLRRKDDDGPMKKGGEEHVNYID